MSSNRELAEAYLEDAEYTIEEARRALNRGYYHRAVRRARECVELCLKAVLRLYGLEYPKAHDVSSMLLRIRDRLPHWLVEKLDFVVEASTTLAMQRAPSFYGDEYRRVPARELFKEEDAIRAMEYASRVLELARRLYRLWIE
ncbi:MAG: DNA-binding protein [Thermoprotei archaeon]|nr:MAG: DNA-binding protein [Thermoprotei archaeon]